jgi:DNA-3-methyladenine glycosylase II
VSRHHRIKVIHQNQVTTLHLTPGHHGSVTDDSGRAAWLSGARSYLRDADPVLARLIDDRPDFDPRAWISQLPAMDLFGALLFQVTGQQLSVAATRRTLARIQDMFGGHLPAPAELLTAEQEVLAIAEKWRPYRSLATSYLFSAAFDPGRLPGLVIP